MNKLLLCVLALGMSSMTFAGNENVFDPPVMGWSSWNTYRVNINEALIKKQADAMVQKGLKDAGYNYVNVDDGFFGWRDEHGTMQTHPERFPNGLKGVADHIHRRKIQILINDIFHRPPFRADITTDTPRAADILCPCTRKSPSAHINGNMVTRHFIKSTANLRISFFLIQTQLLRSTAIIYLNEIEPPFIEV